MKMSLSRRRTTWMAFALAAVSAAGSATAQVTALQQLHASAPAAAPDAAPVAAPAGAVQAAPAAKVLVPRRELVRVFEEGVPSPDPEKLVGRWRMTYRGIQVLRSDEGSVAYPNQEGRSPAEVASIPDPLTPGRTMVALVRPGGVARPVAKTGDGVDVFGDGTGCRLNGDTLACRTAVLDTLTDDSFDERKVEDFRVYTIYERVKE